MTYSWKRPLQLRARSANKIGKTKEGLSRGGLLGAVVSLVLEWVCYITAFALVASVALALFLQFM